MRAGKERAVCAPLGGAPVPPVQVLWGQACRQVQEEISVEKFASWVKPLHIGNADENSLYLVAPNAFFRDWVRENLGRRLDRAWQSVDPLDRSLCFRADQDQAGPDAPHAEAPNAPVKTGRMSAPDAGSKDGDGNRSSGFDDFVVADSNEVAFTVARQVSQGFMASFNNPFFVFGGYGMGKTHLLRAIGSIPYWRHTGRRVRYLTAEEFVFGYVAAVRERDTRQFKQELRALDLLLVDDLQFILGKQASQDEFFHTLRALTASGAQLVLSADQAPTALEGLHPGLLSRIAGGLVCEIRPADFALRREILKRRVVLLAQEFHGLAVPADVLDIIAGQVCTNPRELIGALNTIVSRTAYVGRPLTGALCREILADLVRDPARKVSIAQIQKAVAAHFELSLEQLLSRRRTRNIVRPRQIAMHLCKHMTTCSLPMIGGRFKGRDHATVIHANRQITALAEKDAVLAEDIRAIRQTLMRAPLPSVVRE